MSSTPRSHCAGLLAALTSLVALSCGSDTIDLLPTLAGASGGSASGSGGAGGSFTTAGTEASGGSNSGMPGNGGMAGASAGVGGSAGGRLGSGGHNGCSGPGCGGSLGGAFPFLCEQSSVSSCQPCADEGQCPANQHCAQHFCAECARDDDCNGGVCDKFAHRCAPMCQNSIECRGGRICDTTFNACVTCTQTEGCPPSTDMDARICDPYLRRCIECLGDANCGGDRKHCVRYQCVCLNNADCGDGMFCDQNSGRCRPP